MILTRIDVTDEQYEQLRILAIQKKVALSRLLADALASSPRTKKAFQ